jgi:hypothetical protein
MIEEKLAKNKSNYYALTFFSLIFIAIFICAGLFVKAEYGSGAKPKPTAGPKAPATAGMAGRYVGFTTISSGICSVGAHEFVLEIDEDGNVKSSYGMKADKLMAGRINPDGRIRLSFRDSGFVVAFEGELHSNQIYGHSTVTGDRTCDIAWELWRS